MNEKFLELHELLEVAALKHFPLSFLIVEVEVNDALERHGISNVKRIEASESAFLLRVFPVSYFALRL